MKAVRIPRHIRRAIHAQPSPRHGKPVLCVGGPNRDRLAAYGGKRVTAAFGNEKTPQKAEYRLGWRRIFVTNPRTGRVRTIYQPVYEWYGPTEGM